jgi:hypothetical protein
MHQIIVSWYFRQGSGTVHRQAARTTCTQEVFVTRAGMVSRAESTGRRPGHTHHPSGHAHNTGGTP